MSRDRLDYSDLPPVIEQDKKSAGMYIMYMLPISSLPYLTGAVIILWNMWGFMLKLLTTVIVVDTI